VQCFSFQEQTARYALKPLECLNESQDSRNNFLEKGKDETDQKEKNHFENRK
jgi:hypothetical protein